MLIILIFTQIYILFFQKHKLFAYNLYQTEAEIHRNISEFILLGLSYKYYYTVCFFILVSFLVSGKPSHLYLHSVQSFFNQPMYCFLSHLSFIDICCTPSATPKLIGDMLVDGKKTFLWQLHVTGPYWALLQRHWDLYSYFHGFWLLMLTSPDLSTMWLSWTGRDAISYS